MKNKKAFILPEEVLKLLIALLCIAILVYLAVSLYGIFKQKTRLEQAKSTLDEFIGQIQAMKDGDSSSYLALAPKGWYIVFYDKDIVAADPKKGMPMSCKGASCLCVCPTDTPLEAIQQHGSNIIDAFYHREKEYYSGLSHCENEGVCRNYVAPLKFDITQAYGKKGLVLITADSAKVNWISLQEAPVNIFMSDESGTVTVRLNDDSAGILMRGLLSKQISYNNEQLTFEQFAMKYLANNCGSLNLMGSDINKARTFGTSEISSYAQQFKDNNPSVSDVAVSVYADTSTGLQGLSTYGTFSGRVAPSTSTNSKQLCSGKIPVSIKVEVRKK